MGDSGIAPGKDFEVWKNNNRGGDGDAYTGAQGQSKIKDNSDSLETAASTWVIVFSDKDYTGDSMQVGPNTYLSDLKKVRRYDDSGVEQGDWKSQISSFVLYKAQPAFWGQKPNSSQLFDPGPGNAILTEDDYFLGANRYFVGPYSAVNLQSIGYTTNSKGMYQLTGGTVNALRTGVDAWMVIFDALSCAGNALKVNPNTIYPKLENVSRKDLDGNSLGNWKNEMGSFLLYTAKPAFWDTAYPRPYIDFEALAALYPGTTSDSGSSGKITYVIEDATYDIKDPEFVLQAATQTWSGYQGHADTSVLPADGWTEYAVSMSHENTGGRNDHANFQLYFDNAGNLISIQEFEWTSDGAYNISEALITIVDDEAELLGAIGALETLGISEEVADAFVKVFDFVTTLFNDITQLVYKLTDNGGRYYFLPVICHTVNRICTTVLNGYNLQTYSSQDNERNGYQFDFDYAGYLNALAAANTGINSLVNWSQKSGDSNAMSQVMEYRYEGYAYRTWYQEVSYSVELGMIVSCKIDYEIDDNKDDHIILLMGFTVPSAGATAPSLSFAQATIQFTDNSNDNIMSQAHKGSTAIDAVCDDLAEALATLSIDSSEGGRSYLADIAKANMQAMANCTRYAAGA